MIPRIEIIIIKDGEIHRETFKLPDVPMEQFEQNSHWNVHFNWGSDAGFEKNGIRVWTHVELSDAERQYLIYQGKMAAFIPKDSSSL